MSTLDNISLKKGEPTDLTITISVEQAALIAHWAGKFSPAVAQDAIEHTSDLFNLLEGDFFIRFYDDGVKDALRTFGLPDLTAALIENNR